jgi:hypothetical protein
MNPFSRIRNSTLGLAALPAMTGCAVAILAFLFVPNGASATAEDVRHGASAAWGCLPAPVETQSIHGRRGGWSGARPAYEPSAALSGVAGGALPAWQSDRLPPAAQVSGRWRAAGIHLSRAPPRNTSL